MTNLTVRAIPYDRMWECWCECIMRRQKSFPSAIPVPQWAMGVLFFRSFFFSFFSFDYMKTSLAIKTHLEPAYETDSGRFSAVGCGASSKQWSRPVGTATTHQPPTFTDPLSTKLDHPPARPPPLPQPQPREKNNKKKTEKGSWHTVLKTKHGPQSRLPLCAHLF